MRNLLAFLAAAALTVGGVGWYRGWFVFQTNTQPSGHRNLSIDINSPKIGEDLQRGRQYLLQQSEGRAHSPTPPEAKDEGPASEAGKGSGPKPGDGGKGGERKPAPKQ